jgi:hypothetical protein
MSAGNPVISIPSDMLEVRAPNELRSGLDLQQARFYDRGGGQLGLKVSGSFGVNNQNSLPLCRKFWPEAQCKPQ